MSTTQTPPSTGSGRRLVRSAVVLALALATMGLSFSGAFFTDQAVTDVATITTGTVDLTAPSTIDFSLTNMAPGDESNQSLLVDNTNSSLQTRYSLTTTATDSDASFPLSAQLDAILYLESEEAGLLTGDTAGVCEATYAEADAYTAVSKTKLGSLTFTDRVVAAGASELFCIVTELADATGNDYQGDTTDVTFTFDAEQTVNNP